MSFSIRIFVHSVLPGEKFNSQRALQALIGKNHGLSKLDHEVSLNLGTKE